MVSIILATYNGAKYIRNAIESVLSQSVSSWELIIIDDGSTDNTVSIVSEYVKTDPRIILLNNEVNLGVPRSLNKSLDIAKGEYIARIDDDDIWTDKDKLRKQVDFLNQNPEYVMVGTSGVVVEENGNRVAEYLVPQEDIEIKNSILLKNPFIHSSVVFRKNAVLKVGGYYYKEGLKYAEDYDLWLKLSSEGKFYNITEPMVAYMLRGNSLNFINKYSIIKYNIYLLKEYKNIYPHYYRALFLALVKLGVYHVLSLTKNEGLKYKINKLLIKHYRKFNEVC